MQIEASQPNPGLALSGTQRAWPGDAAGKAEAEPPANPAPLREAAWDLAACCQAVGTLLVVGRRTKEKASTNLHPESLQSHCQEHVAKILLRAPRQSPSSHPGCKGTTSEAVCSI